MPFLVWVPVATSVTLGVVYMFSADGRARSKLVVAGVFFVAVYLQFFSRHALAGLLLNVGLAISLLLWRKATSGLR